MILEASDDTEPARAAIRAKMRARIRKMLTPEERGIKLMKDSDGLLPIGWPPTITL